MKPKLMKLMPSLFSLEQTPEIQHLKIIKHVKKLK